MTEDAEKIGRKLIREGLSDTFGSFLGLPKGRDKGLALMTDPTGALDHGLLFLREEALRKEKVVGNIQQRIRQQEEELEIQPSLENDEDFMLDLRDDRNLLDFQREQARELQDSLHYFRCPTNPKDRLTTFIEVQEGIAQTLLERTSVVRTLISSVQNLIEQEESSGESHVFVEGPSRWLEQFYDLSQQKLQLDVLTAKRSDLFANFLSDVSSMDPPQIRLLIEKFSRDLEQIPSDIPLQIDTKQGREPIALNKIVDKFNSERRFLQELTAQLNTSLGKKDQG